MKSGTITGLLGGGIVAGFSLGAFGEIKENPYQVIIDRNPFGLRPIPIVEPPKAPEPPPPPPLKITLTGITTLLGAPRVLLEVTDPQTQKTDRLSPMEVNENYKDITIVSIDPDNNLVKVKIGDAETTLDFLKNGAKASTASAAPVPHPGMPGGNPFVPQVPSPVSALGQPANNNPYGSRSIVGGATAAVPTAQVGYNPGAVAANGGILPPRTVRTDSGAAIVSGAGGYQQSSATP